MIVLSEEKKLGHEINEYHPTADMVRWFDLLILTVNILYFTPHPPPNPHFSSIRIIS